MKLRDYQKVTLDKILTELPVHRTGLFVYPTGMGKTITFAEAVKAFAKKGRVMVLAHREELVDQAVDKIRAMTSLRCDVEMAERHATEGMWKSEVVVSSIQTQVAGRNGNKRMQRFKPEDFSLVVFDEAHHIAAKSWMMVFEHYRQNPDLCVLGCTATPDRHDEITLAKAFTHVIDDLDILDDGINKGWLVDVDQRSIQVEDLDFSKVRTTAGDLNQGDLADVMEQERILHEVAVGTMDQNEGRQTLVFAATVAQAKRLCEIFLRYSVTARIVTGKTPKEERRHTITEYRNGKVQYLVNVGVALEGFDVPEIGCVSIARPTKSRALYAQAIGRGTRPWPGLIDGIDDPAERVQTIRDSCKPTVIVLDFVGNAGKHKLKSSVDVLGGRWPDEVVERARVNIQKDGKANVRDALQHAERQLAEERERRSRSVVQAEGKVRSTAVNPFDVLDIRPVREPAWHKGRKPSVVMREALLRFRVPEKEIDGLSFVQASALIKRLIERSQKNLCTYRQRRMLKRYGYKDATFDEAKRIMDALAKNNWKRPEKDPTSPAWATDKVGSGKGGE